MLLVTFPRNAFKSWSLAHAIFAQTQLDAQHICYYGILELTTRALQDVNRSISLRMSKWHVPESHASLCSEPRWPESHVIRYAVNWLYGVHVSHCAWAHGTCWNRTDVDTEDYQLWILWQFLSSQLMYGTVYKWCTVLKTASAWTGDCEMHWLDIPLETAPYKWLGTSLWVVSACIVMKLQTRDGNSMLTVVFINPLPNHEYESRMNQI